MPVRLYSICLARFQFLESRSYKIRPVIIVSRPRGQYKTVLAIPLSSQLVQEDIDIVLNWQASGLIGPTVARVHRLAAIPGRNILEQIGQLNPKDLSTLKGSLKKILEL